uniref:Uncharacterized protein n=1 Tax=Quercus lobata TaxID=97700 RepID=A0A7N2LN91_QUELO
MIYYSYFLYLVTSFASSSALSMHTLTCLSSMVQIDFHLVQLFFACMPSLAVYLVAQYARYDMRKMEAVSKAFSLYKPATNKIVYLC